MRVTNERARTSESRPSLLGEHLGQRGTAFGLIVVVEELHVGTVQRAVLDEAASPLASDAIHAQHLESSLHVVDKVH